MGTVAEEKREFSVKLGQALFYLRAAPAQSGLQ